MFALNLFFLQAQVIEVNARLDSTKMRIGEHIKFYIEIKKEEGTKVRIGEFQDSLSSKIEILKTDSVKIDENQILNKIFTLTSFEPGIYTLPSVPVIFETQELNDTIFSKQVLLEVYSPEVDTTKSIKDIKAPINTPLTFKEAIPYVAVGWGILALIAFITYVFIRYRRKKPLFQKPIKALPAHIIAFEELDRLKEKNYLQSGNIRDFYIRLSDIIRIYLENRYEFKAREYVTDEIIMAFRKNIKESEIIEMLTQILQTADMVKFAKGNPSPSDSQSNFDNAYLFVEKTKLVEIIKVEEMQKQAEILNYTDKKL